MKKIMSVLVIICLICISGCRVVSKPTDPTELPKGFDYDRFQVTQEEIDAQHQKYGKLCCENTVNDDFAIGRVLVKVYPFANHVEYTVDDFAEIGCTRVNVLLAAKEEQDKPTKLLVVEFEASTKQDVLDIIKILEQRADVYSANPSIIYAPATDG